MSDPVNSQKLYQNFEDHKYLLAIDLDNQMDEDARGIYEKARSEIATALAKTESGTHVYNILNQALNDMPQNPKSNEELLENYNKALKDLGPLS